jgi:hypothetical protein
MDTLVCSAVAHVRQRRSPADEGSPWVFVFDDTSGAPVLAIAFAACTDAIDEPMLKNLAKVIVGIGSRRVLVAIPRQTGTPNLADHRLWINLSANMPSCVRLTDLLVVGNTKCWSARASAGASMD